MVTTAFLLFTVSTLTAQINAIPANINHDPCEGQTYCFEKPANYPQEEMDRIVAQSDLHHLHRIKRETQLAFRKSNKTDECVASEEMAPLFTATDSSGITRNVLQSGFFSQMLPKVTCRTRKTCFSNPRDGNFACEETVTIMNILMVHNGKAEAMPHHIVTGCYCAKKK